MANSSGDQIGSPQAVYVSVGSNVNKLENIRSGVQALRTAYGDITVSTVYESVAVGFDGENFYNLVVGFRAENLPDLSNNLRRIEAEHGRQRGEVKFSSRTLDLDILLFGDQDFRSQGLDIPRAEILTYSFVLQPLAEIAPHALHPLTGKSYYQHWQEYLKENQCVKETLWPIAFPW